MRSRWFHRPVFHTGLQHEKKVTWIELFYDLIFVAAIIQLGDALSQGISDHRGWAAAGEFVVHFVPLLVAWMGFTFYVNRYDHDDIIQRSLVFAKMFSVGAMAITSPIASHAGDIAPVLFTGAFALALGIVTFMYLRVCRHNDDARADALYWAKVFGAGAALCAVGVFLPSPGREIATALAVATVFVGPITRQARALQDLFPLDQEHLAERFGLLTIIVLGESFVKVLSYLNDAPAGDELAYLAKGAQNLLITCCLWWIYFDDVAGSHVRKGRGNWIVWLYAHVPLTASVTALGVALKKALAFDPGLPPPADYRWLLAGSLACVLFSVAVIDSVTQRVNSEASDRFRFRSRVVAAMVVLIIAPSGSAMSSRMFLLLLTGICLAQVVFDLLSAPLTDSDEEEFSMAEHKARQVERADRARGRGKARPDIGDAVRKGAPAELRQDFYYFFLEGSWTRLFMCFGGIFVLLNVFFAGLYLLEPGSIQGMHGESFIEAFSFSVQTISTIGYGALSPASDYGNLIVSIEAAVGILSVAVATGVVFAKLSRPSAAVLFSKPVIITEHEGQPTLIFRVGNARGNELVDATISITVIREHVTPEGEHMRRMLDLKLTRARTPFFALSWTVMHVLDADSPLADVDWDHIDEFGLTGMSVTLMGHDSTYGQSAHARHMYYPEDFAPGRRFVDVLSFLDDGRLVIDYTKFHDLKPLEAEQLTAV